ncbi:glutathione synthetase-like [Oppia nitens]|uniref:glutathione synthetase-like n=1 Tax=Oppia nitens TaxID=1686743 RepID=UPI0023DA5459|nr:glutathione synthetase-like [Oppia nitens]
MDQLTQLVDSLTADDLLAIEREVKDYALAKGIAFKLANSPPDTVSLAPLTLFPSPFPRKHFDFGHRLQPLVNAVSHKIAYDHGFLADSLAKTVQVDDFTAKMFDVYTQVRREGMAQTTSLGLFRADYMLDERPDGGGGYDLKQVEVNNISTSFCGLAPAVRDVHRHVLAKYGASADIGDLDKRLPINRSTELMAAGLIKAYDYYNRSSAVILVVVEQVVVNIFDQRAIEFTVSRSRPDIRLIRRTFAQLRDAVRLGNNRELIVDNKHEVAVVYYRTAYAPQDYAGDQDWDVRLLMERSRAVKCPSIQYHLTGCKKIQQIVSNRQVVEKFVADRRDVDDLMQVFAGLWGLESGPDGDQAIDMALGEPNRFVLKPQREGGGYNYFGGQLARKLDEIRHTKERESYILMELIRPPKVPNHILAPNKSLAANSFRPSNITCEFGVFGTVMGNADEIILNSEAGHLIRSKTYGTNEGGVAAGFGALDSPYLY